MKIVYCVVAFGTVSALIAAMTSPSMGKLIETSDKYGTCETPTDVDGKKCEGQSGNCFSAELFECQKVSLKCPNGGVATKTGAPIMYKQYGTCTGTATTTGGKCPKCAFFYCAQAKLWVQNTCPPPDDVNPACTVAVGRANVCNPN